MCSAGCSNSNVFTRSRSPLQTCNWEISPLPRRSKATLSGFGPRLLAATHYACLVIVGLCVTVQENSELFTPNYLPQAKFCLALWPLMPPLFVSPGEEVLLPRMPLWILKILLMLPKKYQTIRFGESRAHSHTISKCFWHVFFFINDEGKQYWTCNCLNTRYTTVYFSSVWVGPLIY